MTAADLRLGRIWLDRRWFVGFLCLQAGLIAGILLLPIKLLQVIGVGVGGGILLSLLVLYPWIIVPAIVATTALDISGKIIETTALGIPLTGFHLALGLMIVGLGVNTFLRRRTQFPPFQLAVPLFLLLGVMAISVTYSSESTRSDDRIHADAGADFVSLFDHRHARNQNRNQRRGDLDGGGAHCRFGARGGADRHGAFLPTC